MGKIIITGAAGFIGSNLVQFLNNNGRHDIIVVDKPFALERGYISISDSLLGGVEQMMSIDEFSLRCLSYVKNEFINIGNDFFENIDAVFHLGAEVDTSSSEYSVLDFNYTFSQILFDACFKANIPVLFASSAAVYGNSKEFHEDQENLSPLNVYGVSKLLSEEYIKEFSNIQKWFGFRFFNVYGPNEFHKGNMASAVTQIYVKAREGKEITLFKSINPEYKDGHQSRDFIHVNEVIETMWHFFEHRNEIDNGVYNLGTGQATSFLDIANTVILALKSETIIPIKFIDTPDILKKSYQSFTKANMSKTKKIIDIPSDPEMDLIRYFTYLNNKYSINFGKESNYTLAGFYNELTWK